jgi:hypothetical protein
MQLLIVYPSHEIQAIHPLPVDSLTSAFLFFTGGALHPVTEKLPRVVGNGFRSYPEKEQVIHDLLDCLGLASVPTISYVFLNSVHLAAQDVTSVVVGTAMNPSILPLDFLG